jgi:hypothetical protein
VDIISVINGIAFQNNILALSAVVEAARAGEQGRGFAVVTTKVHNLAQRSAAAAKEIKALIGDSVDKVDAGARLVDEVGTTMSEIVDNVVDARCSLTPTPAVLSRLKHRKRPDLLASRKFYVVPKIAELARPKFANWLLD